MVILVVPPTHEVHHEEDDGHPSRDEENGSHRLLLLLLRRCLTSGLLLRLLWLSATGSRQLILRGCCRRHTLLSVSSNGHRSPILALAKAAPGDRRLWRSRPCDDATRVKLALGTFTNAGAPERHCFQKVA
jgi:hypothetical protein